jgi:hypothetical protein
MRKTGFALFLVLTVCQTHAQQDNLVLIDAENDQPFYARIGEKILNSSSIGHLSIPHLRDSTYIIDIGFPENQFPEQKYSIKVSRKDLGFQLRNLGEKGWVLYNWQTQEMKMPSSESIAGSHAGLGKSFKKDDAFSRLMAAVVNDTSVMYNTYSPAEPIKKDTVQNVVTNTIITTEKASLPPKNESSNALVKTGIAVQTAKEKKPARHVIADAHPGITKYLEESTDREIKIIYVDVSARGFADTISIIILKGEDNGNLSMSNAENKDPQAGRVVSVGQGDAHSNEAPNNNNKKKAVPLPKCKATATDYDIDVLRLNILTERTIDKRIAVAKKYFAGKCVSTSQVKTLTELFDEDKDKFDFFKMAYPRVTDRENFGQLSAMFKENQYVEAFNEQF